MEPTSATIEGLGKLSAFIVNEKSKIILRVVAQFPHHGEKPLYRLTKEASPANNPHMLVLSLNFSGTIKEGAPQTLGMTYSEELTIQDQYNSVIIIGDSDSHRILAKGKVE